MKKIIGFYTIYGSQDRLTALGIHEFVHENLTQSIKRLANHYLVQLKKLSGYHIIKVSYLTKCKATE